MKRLSRFPNDDSLRPSTQETMVTGIRVSHQIVVEVKHGRRNDPGHGDGERGRAKGRRRCPDVADHEGDTGCVRESTGFPEDCVLSFLHSD